MRHVSDSIAKATFLPRAEYVVHGLILFTGTGSNFHAQVDGIIVIFDVETNGVAHKLRGHTRQIQSLRQAVLYPPVQP